MSLVVVYVAPNRTLDQAHCPGTKCPHTQCPAISRCGGVSVCVSVWVPCVALPNGGGSSVGPSPLCGSPVWVPCAGPLCGSPVWVPSVWVPCVGPLCGSLAALRHVASTRVMPPARSHAPAYFRRLGLILLP